MTAGSLMWLNLFIIGMIFPFLVVREKQTHLLFMAKMTSLFVINIFFHSF